MTAVGSATPARTSVVCVSLSIDQIAAELADQAGEVDARLAPDRGDLLEELGVALGRGRLRGALGEAGDLGRIAEPDLDREAGDDGGRRGAAGEREAATATGRRRRCSRRNWIVSPAADDPKVAP